MRIKDAYYDHFNDEVHEIYKVTGDCFKWLIFEGVQEFPSREIDGDIKIYKAFESSKNSYTSKCGDIRNGR